jgi:glutathione S-transferase
VLDDPIHYVDLATAQASRGVRLVVLGSLPSPWSEAAKGLFRLKQLPALAVRVRRGDDELRAWTGAHNAPVALAGDEPPRSGWAEILALAERLGGSAPLVPAGPAARVRLHGLAHELAGEGGLGWCNRLVMIHGSLASAGTRSFPLPLAQYLAGKYGYAPERVAPARARVAEILSLFDGVLAESRAAGHRYLLGAEPSALDVYLATFLTPMLGLSESDCPGVRPEARAAFAHLRDELGAALPAPLAAHHALIYGSHLPWPIAL